MMPEMLQRAVWWGPEQALLFCTTNIEGHTHYFLWDIVTKEYIFTWEVA